VDSGYRRSVAEPGPGGEDLVEPASRPRHQPAGA